MLTGSSSTYLSLQPFTGLPAGVTVRQVSGGGYWWKNQYHVVALGSDGKLYGTGSNLRGQLTGAVGSTGATTLTELSRTGLPAGTITAVAANGMTTTVVVGGRAYQVGQYKNFVADPPGAGDSVSSWRLVGADDPDVDELNRDVAAIVAGRNYTLLVGADGSVRGTGFNGSSQLGHPASTAEGGYYETGLLVPVAAAVGPVAEIGADDQSTVLRDRTGLLWGTGSNYYSQLARVSSAPEYRESTFAPLNGQVNALVDAPTVRGTAKVGRPLTATAGTWFVRPASPAYQWLRDGAPISGATGSTYRPATDDAGRRLSVRVTAQHPHVPALTATSASTTVALHATARPRLKGKKRVGKRLRATTGTWAGAPTSFSYQWLRAGKPIAKATAPRYRLKKRDAGKKVSVRVTAHRAGVPEGTATSKAVKVTKKRRSR